MQRRLGTVNWVLEETTPTKPHQEGGDRYLLQFWLDGGQQRANSRKRERSDRISPTKIRSHIR